MRISHLNERDASSVGAGAWAKQHYYLSSVHIRRASPKTRVYGKRQTSESRLRFLKINNKHKRIVQNSSCVYGKHEST